MKSSEKQLTKKQRNFLQSVFPGETCLLEPEHTLIYGTDASRMFAQPLAVVRPRTHDQVVELLAWAQAERMPVYPRARASNVVGACVPRLPGVVVSTLLMNRVLEVNTEDFVAVVEPGVITSVLQQRVEQDGLFYPPDPASMAISTIGGNVATGAGGMRAVKYGVTREYVLGLTAVLPGGEVIEPGGRTHKNVVGLDLLRLLVGSEGTLAFTTKITLKLLPKPEESASLLCAYESLDEALAGARAVFKAGILPVAMELIAEDALTCIETFTSVPWPKQTRAALLLKLDGSAEALPLDLKKLSRVIGETSPVFVEQGIGPAQEEPLWELRRSLNPASFRLRPNKMSDDITVPRGRVGVTIDGIKKVAKDMGLIILTFGHLGDGNIHVNVMYDASVQGEQERARKAKERIQDIVLRNQGSLSGEHGVGLTKAPYVHKQLSERERMLMRSIKAAFDPLGIMNPGKGF